MDVPKSRFLEFYSSYRARLSECSELIGDIILVEKVQFPEAKVGSILLASSLNQVNNLVKDIPTFYRVLHVGTGYVDEDTGDDVALDCRPGDIILVPETAVKSWGRFPLLEIPESNVIGIVNYSNVQWRFKSEEDFWAFLRDFNSAAKGKVPG
jgi:hypothetical protein